MCSMRPFLRYYNSSRSPFQNAHRNKSNTSRSVQQHYQSHQRTSDSLNNRTDLSNWAEQSTAELHVSVASCIADEVSAFFDSFNDSVTPLVDSPRELPINFQNLQASSRKLFNFCCVNKMTRSQMAAQYDLQVTQNCHCAATLQSQFPTSPHLYAMYYWPDYMSLQTRDGRKSQFRLDLVRTVRGFPRHSPYCNPATKRRWWFVLYHHKREKVCVRERVYSNPMDSDAMLTYYRGMPSNAVLIGSGFIFGWYNYLRVRIAVIVLAASSVISEERSMLKQRFMYAALCDTIQASRSGFLYNGTIVFLRVNTLVCDQKEERSILSLRAQGSYRDCTHCLLPTLPFPEAAGASLNADIPTEAFYNVDGSIFSGQCRKEFCAPNRSVVNTLSRQIIVGRAKFATIETNDLFMLHRAAVARAKEYLKRTSAAPFPPALGALLLPDHAFTLFNSYEYNKGKYTGRELQPRSEKHASMTGKIRRMIAPFLWVALLGLQPEGTPDKDVLLQSALALDRFQSLLKGINMRTSNAKRTTEDISKIQRFAFDSCLWLSHALAIPISTKLHRSMRHMADALFMFGCSRRVLHEEDYDLTSSSGLSSTTDEDSDSYQLDDEESNLAVGISNLITQLNLAVVDASADNVNSIVCQLRHTPTNNTIWTPVTRVRFRTRLSWQTEEEAKVAPIYQFARVVPIVRDMFDVSQRYSIAKIPIEIGDTVHERKLANTYDNHSGSNDLQSASTNSKGGPCMKIRGIDLCRAALYTEHQRSINGAYAARYVTPGRRHRTRFPDD
eukprot:IDg21954t1